MRLMLDDSPPSFSEMRGRNRLNHHLYFILGLLLVFQRSFGFHAGVVLPIARTTRQNEFEKFVKLKAPGSVTDFRVRMSSNQEDDYFDELDSGYAPRLDESIERMESWILRNGGKIEGVKIAKLPPTTNDDPQGWGLETTADVAQGTVLARVPRHLCLAGAGARAPHGCPPETALALEALQRAARKQAPEELREGDVAELAVAVLSERTKGAQSFYAPYVGNLPALFRGFPVFFNVTELHALEDQSTIAAVKERCAFLLKFAGRGGLADAAAPHQAAGADPFSGYDIDANVLGWAVAAAASRAIELEPGRRELVPFIDMANHDFCANAAVRLSADGAAAELVALRALGAGRAVNVSYGTLTSNELLLNHGFTAWPNPYDRVGVQFGQRLLQAARILMDIQKEPFGDPAGEQDEVQPWQLKKLKELKLEGLYADLEVEIGGPMIIDPRLLAALRILFAESSAELGNASLDTLKTWNGSSSRSVERRVITTALGICFILQRAFTTTIQDDEREYSGKDLFVNVMGKGDRTQVQFISEQAFSKEETQEDAEGMDRSSSRPSASWEMKEAIKYRKVKKQLIIQAIARLYGKLEVLGVNMKMQDMDDLRFKLVVTKDIGDP